MNASEFLKGRIAVAGASRSLEKYGRKVFDYLLSKGYDVVPVNPSAPEISSIKTWKSPCEGKANSLILVTKPDVSEKIVREALDCGIRKFWFQPGSESERAIQLIREKGGEYIEGLCLIADGLGDAKWMDMFRL